MKNQSMTRTQIYLTKEQEQALKTLALLSGKHQSLLIREAIDLLLNKSDNNLAQFSWKQSLNNIQGIWKDNDIIEQNMLDIRSEFDRF
jgi:predicted DNA-binding protein